MIKSKALLGMLILILTAFLSSGCSLQKESKSEKKDVKTARIVGYLSTDNFDKMKLIQFKKVTHLNLAFANPDKTGKLYFPGDIDKLVKYVRGENPNIKISISIAGGIITKQQSEDWSYLIDNSQNRPLIINSLIKFIKQHQLDGVDVDLEWDAVTAGYSDFILELHKQTKPLNLLLTSALPNLTRFNYITDQALNAFDFINIMAYDMTGPWNANKKGAHSSYQDTLLGVDFWTIKNNLPADKIILGVPFYGYNFGTLPVTSFAYGDIVKLGNEYAELDQKEESYYNGRNTIRRKVDLASQRCGGIMIWELSQDSFSEYSLLNVIAEQYKSLGYNIN
ncbi:chitinase [Flavobacterium sp. PL11]|uniref:glycosyl hydrolase family 18 protein n=1 Tax=Flavobacterium sp. PL11 TaxID=3071717 RepID=UPI002E06130B|nr:chitinase [Flavobacterium sp. PL11]